MNKFKRYLVYVGVIGLIGLVIFSIATFLIIHIETI